MRHHQPIWQLPHFSLSTVLGVNRSYGLFPPMEMDSDSDSDSDSNSKPYCYIVLCTTFSTGSDSDSDPCMDSFPNGYCTHFRDGSQSQGSESESVSVGGNEPLQIILLCANRSSNRPPVLTVLATCLFAGGCARDLPMRWRTENGIISLGDTVSTYFNHHWWGRVFWVSQIWTQKRKLEFFIFGVGVGVFCVSSDLNSGKKVRFFIFRGGCSV